MQTLYTKLPYSYRPRDIPDVQIRTSYVNAFEGYRLTDRQTDRHDRNYIPHRIAGRQ